MWVDVMYVHEIKTNQPEGIVANAENMRVKSI
jgi:hypothetical protein